MMSIMLIGPRGSGKTTIGRILADRLWQKFVDIDDLIVERCGKCIKDIFAQDGEPHFRDVETQVLRDACKLADHVIGLGGGTPMREENQGILKQSGHKLIYLRCDPEELQRRVESDPRSAATRPNLTALGGGIEEIRHLLSIREPVYRRVMHMELDVTRLTPQDAATYILRLA